MLDIATKEKHALLGGLYAAEAMTTIPERSLVFIGLAPKGKAGAVLAFDLKSKTTKMLPYEFDRPVSLAALNTETLLVACADGIYKLDI